MFTDNTTHAARACTTFYIMQTKPIKPGSTRDKGALQLAVLSVAADGGVFAWPGLSSWSQRLAPDTFGRSAGGHELAERQS